MLTWIRMEHENGFIGFDDKDRPRYFVREDEDGWYWEDSWGFGYGDFDTAEQAKADAEADCPAPSYSEQGFTDEEIEEIKACREAHERMEIAKGLGW